MSKPNVMIYINDQHENDNKLLEQMDNWNITYETKDVSRNRAYMKELQNDGIYGTPVTFVDGTAILGFQESRLKQVLGIRNSY